MVAVLVSLYLYPLTRMLCEAPDAGVFLNGADLLNRGAVPSRDFVEPQGPGSFLWLALFFRLFGPTLTTARAVLDATGVGMGLLAFYLSRRLGATGLFALIFVVGMSLPLMPVNSPHYDSNLFAFAALAVFLVAWEKIMSGHEPDAAPLIATSVLCGIVTIMLQQKGVCLMAAMLITTAWAMRAKAKRTLLTLAIPFFVVALTPFAVFAALHALPDFLVANYIWPIQKYSELNAAPYAFPLWHDLQWQVTHEIGSPLLLTRDLIATVPFFTVAALPFLLPLIARLSGRRWLSTRWLPYWLVGYALWFGELHRVDIGHLRNGVMLLAVLFLSICEVSSAAFLRYAAFAMVAVIAAIGCAGLLTSLGDRNVFETRRGEMHVGDNRPLLRFLDTHTRAGDEVFIYPYQPIYYFVENLVNPTRYSYMQYHLHTDAQFREATDDLERKKVRYVVFDDVLCGDRFQDIFPAYRQPSRNHLIMEPYLDAHYQVRENLGRFRILERK